MVRHLASSYDDVTALVVVDTQNDFADPDGSLYVDGGDEVVPLLNTEVEAARQDGALVVFTQDWHPESTPHFQKDGGVWPVHCVMGTWGAEFHPALKVEGEVVRKGSGGEDGYSGFSVRDPRSGDEHDTSLDAILRDSGIRRVVVTGIALDYCVKETALDAARRGYETEVVRDLTRAVNREPGDADRAVEELQAAGVTVR